jgi:signal transduction histidine kinase
VGNVIGTLSSGGDITERRRAEAERAHLAEEAASAAARARDHLWRRVQQLCVAAIGITAEHELARVLQEVAHSAREVIGAEYAALGILDGSGKELSTFVFSGIRDDDRARIGGPPQGKGILGVLIADPKPLRLRDLRAHPESYGFPPRHPSMGSFLGVPIVGRSGPIGNLYLAEKRGAKEFSKEDEALAVMLAAHVAVAVENARLYEEREGLVEELRALQISRTRFFAMINHELRNALTAVHGWTELWLRKAGSDAPRAAQEVAESAERALTLLEDMLDLSRLDASKLKPRVQDADASQVVREAVRALEPVAERRGVLLETVGINGIVSCRTDPLRVRQILINLLSNAVRHSPAGERVTVEVRADDRSMHFDVVDHGEGIPAEFQGRIFEAFERAGTDAERGTGLGLTLSKKLALVLGGDLNVVSTPGSGARFILEVPRYLPGS